MKKIILTFILSIVTITYSNNEKANKYINKAISIDPNNSKFYNLRCECKNKLKDYEGAIEDCKKAINL